VVVEPRCGCRRGAAFCRGSRPRMAIGPGTERVEILRLPVERYAGFVALGP
jgi:hypothetical protein